jgi:hypothetical protein
MYFVLGGYLNAISIAQMDFLFKPNPTFIQTDTLRLPIGTVLTNPKLILDSSNSLFFTHNGIK